jgi:GNAT superfamily N-acetyltransferase
MNARNHPVTAVRPLTVRPARADEIPALTTIPDDSERNASTAAYLELLLTKECTRPEWCLVADTEDGLIGNVVLWAMPGRDVPADIVLLDAPDDATGEALLAAAAALARDLGATEQGHVLDTPGQAPQFQRDAEFREQLLARAGFSLIRDGRRFIRRAGTPLPPQDSRLTWRPLSDLGREPFIDVLADVLVDTADSILRDEVAEHGARGAATLNFDDMAGMDHEPEWYEIGYDADDRPVAISLPARNAGSAVIGLVGVASAHRGRGYATAVVARGTHILADNGATEIRGDCDTANVGMAKAFERAGFTNFANRKMFRRPL